MYRSKQIQRIEDKLDRLLVLLGDGEPPAVAAAMPPEPREPFEGYDQLNVAETLEALKDHKSKATMIFYALEYERANKKRSGVIEQLESWIA